MLQTLICNHTDKELGSTVLYFGCRHKAQDYIYQEELEGFKEEGVLTGLHVAFSRDQEEKVYVQHIMERTGDEVYHLLEKQAYFYVCGYVSIYTELLNCVDKFFKVTDYQKLKKSSRNTITG